MKITELSHTVLRMKVTEHLCCGWSEDDKFFVITNSGLDVFHLKPNPQSKVQDLTFTRSYIFPMAYYPTEHAGFDVEQIRLFSRDDVATLLYDPILVPRMKFATDTPLYFSSALWSPAAILPHRSCMLALLTSVGGVTLWIYKTSAWAVLSDISNYIYLILKGKQALREMKFTSHKYMTEFRRRCYQLATAAVSWSGGYSHEGRTFGYFVTVQKNGDIYIWKIIPISMLDVDIQTDLELMLESGMLDVCCAHWLPLSASSALLLLGDIRGRVHSLFIDISPTYNLTYVKKEVIWSEEDNLKVSVITSGSWENNIKCVIFTKGTFIMMSRLKSSGEVSSTSHKNLHNLLITGLQKVNEKEFIVSTFTGSIFEIILSPGENGDPVISESIVESNVNFSLWGQHGMCVSYNKAIWVMCNSPCRKVQHKLERANSRVVFCRGEGDPEGLLRGAGGTLQRKGDLLETARVLRLKGKGGGDPSWTIHTTPHLLKLCLWINNFDQTKHLSDTKELKQFILLCHVKKYITNLLEKYIQTKFLSQFDLDSVSYQLKFLKYCNKHVKGQQLDDLILSVEKELGCSLPIIHNSCEWCNEPLDNVICSLHHPRQWCCISLQAVEDSCSLKCECCGSSARPELISSAPVCTFCDSRLEYNQLFPKDESHSDNTTDVVT